MYELPDAGDARHAVRRRQQRIRQVASPLPAHTRQQLLDNIPPRAHCVRRFTLTADMTSGVENQVYLAKLAEQAERYEGKCSTIRDWVQTWLTSLS